MHHPLALALSCIAVTGAAAAPAQSFFRELQPSLAGESRPVLADVDGDGDLDLLLVGGPPRLLLNDGLGNFRDDGVVRVPNEREFDFAVCADLDGDGDVDLAAATNDVNGPDASRVLLLQNDGAGQFSFLPSGVPAEQTYVSCLAFADVDGDADLDLFVGRTFFKDQSDAAPDRLFLNDGAGGFTDAPSHLGTVVESTRAACFDDIDGDGDPDLITASTDLQLIQNGQFVVLEGAARVHLNDGQGHFSAGAALGDQASSITTFDADGDGDRDLLTALDTGGGARIQLNDGLGGFTQSPEEFPRFPQLPLQPADFVHDLAVIDVDHDGDDDVLLAWQFYRFPDAGQETDRLHLNDGTGRFTHVADWRDLPGSFPRLGASTAFATGDLDGDGDVDLVGNARDTRIYRSLQRQLTMPFSFPLGAAVPITLRAEPTRAGRPHAAFVALSPNASPLPLPGLGILWLQPGALFELATVAVPAPAGELGVPLTVPTDPALEGLRFTVQALWTGDGVDAPRLSNAQRGQVTR